MARGAASLVGEGNGGLFQMVSRPHFRCSVMRPTKQRDEYQTEARLKEMTLLPPSEVKDAIG